VLDLPLDGLARTRDTKRLVTVETHELQRRRHRRERVAKLMSEHREEFVLASIRLRELLHLLAQRRFRMPALDRLRLEGGGLLLELRDDAQLRVALELHVALGGDHLGVGRRHVAERLRVR
jgi:hypothetical protein